MERAPEARESETRERQTRGPADGGRRETRIEPIMEAPDRTGTSADAVSWNPAQGDRSFGYGSGFRPATDAETDAVADGGDAPEDAR